MANETDVGIVLDNSAAQENSFLSSLKSATGVLSDLFGQAAGAYSTFMGAQTTAELSALQKKNATILGAETQSSILQNKNTINTVIKYGAIAMALFAGVWMFRKATK